ncbi:UNKNOWN [Stylonychia lemnae]|uniref:Uncharacterized protein n=1 Tax=Stylonychia lemnae TaxID=5949 RepID=A0A078AUF5_STYLE|nr:UNKNOWN [Stylonychia lemnae]|eukprot:CDW86025.1 UNKNOWN [Stylonychia lemnae]
MRIVLKIFEEEAAEIEQIIESIQMENDLKRVMRNHLMDLCSYALPPPQIKTIFDIILLIMGKPVKWQNAREEIEKLNFVDNLRNHDISGLTRDQVISADDKISRDISFNSLKKINRAAAYLFLWADNILHLRFLQFKFEDNISEPLKTQRYLNECRLVINSKIYQLEKRQKKQD